MPYIQPFTTIAVAIKQGKKETEGERNSRPTVESSFEEQGQVASTGTVAFFDPMSAPRESYAQREDAGNINLDAVQLDESFINETQGRKTHMPNVIASDSVLNITNSRPNDSDKQVFGL